MRREVDDEEFEAGAWGNGYGRETRRAGNGECARVLFALTDTDHAILALGQCFALARALHADLHIVRVLPRRRSLLSFVPFVPRVEDEDTAQRVQRSLAAFEETKAWFDNVLPERLFAERLRIRFGDSIDEVGSCAADVGAALIVLAPSTGQLGATAISLALVSSKPVLVSRKLALRAPVLAATDLEDDDYCVLRKAVELGAQLAVPVVAVHNVACSSLAFGLPVPVFATAMPLPEAMASREARLARAQSRLQTAVRTVLANEVDPVDAILEQAQVHRAHTIVVGARAHSWLERLFERGVAAEVVNRSDRSVVVAPRRPSQWHQPSSNF